MTGHSLTDDLYVWTQCLRTHHPVTFLRVQVLFGQVVPSPSPSEDLNDWESPRRTGLESHLFPTETRGPRPTRPLGSLAH